MTTPATTATAIANPFNNVTPTCAQSICFRTSHVMSVIRTMASHWTGPR